jgi:hypothetical protein
MGTMRQFDRYPIYVNHPGRWEEARQRQLAEFRSQRDARMVNWLTYTGKRLYEITQDLNPRPESVAYENAVLQQLRLISTTTIGRLLLGCLNRHVKYWIIPLDYLDKAACACGAYVFPGKPNEGGGIRLYYNPTDFNPAAKRWKGADDILFHELVHAYRNGRVGYDMVNAAKPMNDYDNAEEFFALHMQNVYLACRGSHRFYRTYKHLESVSKDTAYQYFVNDAEVLMAFRHYVDHEPLAASVSRWMNPPDSFNPWRDQKVLERLYISSASLGIERLPAF